MFFYSVNQSSATPASAMRSINVWVGNHLNADLDGVLVEIKDQANDTVDSGTTDVNGEVNGLQIAASGNPHTVILSKSGKQTDTLVREFTSDETINWRLMTNTANISAVGSLSATADTKYILTTDLDADGTAITLSGNSGFNIDLNGHTIAYGNTSGGLQNKGFEAGTGTTATGWDANGTGAERTATTTQFMVGSWYMHIPQATTNQTIISDWFDLPTSTACRAYFASDSANNGLNSFVFHQVEIEHSTLGIIAGKFTRGIEDHLLFTSSSTAGQYRYHVTRKGTPTPTTWQIDTEYTIGDLVERTQGDGYVRALLSVGGVGTGLSGGSEPTWTTTLGDTIVDGDITWECAAFGTTESATAWAATTAYGIQDGTHYYRITNQYRRPTTPNGCLYRVVAINLSANSGGDTGTHTGSNDASVLTDSTKSWTINEWATNWRVVNVTDGSSATVLSNTETTITFVIGGLTGGTDNNWDTGDQYIIEPNWGVGIGVTAGASFWSLRMDYEIDMPIDDCGVNVIGQYAITSSLPDRISIYNGTINQVGENYTGHGINLSGADNAIIDNLTVTTYGYDACPINLASCNASEIRHCIATMNSTNRFNRQQTTGAVQITGSTTPYIHHCTVESYSASCIIAALTNALVEYNNVVTHSVVTNHYALLVFGGVNGGVADADYFSTCRYNTVYCDPGEGISMRGQGGGGGAGNICEYNNVTVNSAMPNLEYDEISFDAIRINDYSTTPRNANTKVRYNTLTLNCNFPAGFTPVFQLINGVMAVCSGDGNEINNNTITVNAGNSSEVHGSAINPGVGLHTSGQVDVHDNVITTDEIAFLFGNYATYYRGTGEIRDNTIIRGPNFKANFCLLETDGNAITAIDNGVIHNTTFEHGTLRTFGKGVAEFYTLAPSDWNYSGDCAITVKDETNNPIEGADVVITDDDTNEVYSGTTDVNGRVPTQELIVEGVSHSASQVYTYTAYNDYTISVSKAGYVTANDPHTQGPAAIEVTVTLIAE